MSLIPERDVSNESISAYLKSQGVSNRVEGDGDVYVEDRNLGFPFWISIDRPFKMLMLHTFICFGSTEYAEQALERAHRFADGLITPHFFLEDNDLHARFVMTFREGVLGAHVFDVACRFSDCFMRAKNSPGIGPCPRLLH